MDDGSKAYGKGLARAFGGALLFSFPLLMTMEMWWLGFSMEPHRLLIFILVSLPMLLGLSYYVGFEPTFCVQDEVLDAIAAFGIGVLLSAAILGVFGVLQKHMSLTEVVGKIALCAVPASIGALLAGKQFAEHGDEDAPEKAGAGFLGELFLMMVGSVFLAFNVAPTEEMILISYQMTPVHCLLLIAGSIVALHIFVYELGFPGEARRKGDSKFVHNLVTYTAPGYAIALLVSAYMLWSFGRLDGAALHDAAMMIVVLAFPAAIGAATARLVV